MPMGEGGSPVIIVLRWAFYVPIQDGVYIEAEVYSVRKRSLQQRLRKKTSEHLSKVCFLAVQQAVFGWSGSWYSNCTLCAFAHCLALAGGCWHICRPTIGSPPNSESAIECAMLEDVRNEEIIPSKKCSFANFACKYTFCFHIFLRIYALLKSANCILPPPFYLFMNILPTNTDPLSKVGAAMTSGLQCGAHSVLWGYNAMVLSNGGAELHSANANVLALEILWKKHFPRRCGDAVTFSSSAFFHMKRWAVDVIYWKVHTITYSVQKQHGLALQCR